MNSWGAVNAIVEVTRSNFVYAVTLDPEIGRPHRLGQCGLFPLIPFGTLL